MDLNIAGRKALVCGASAGLGFACAEALAKEGVELVIAARTEATLKEAAAKLSAVSKAPVSWVAADVTTAEGRERIFTAHPDFDIVVTNAGGPPPGDFRNWDRDTWLAALDANMLSPIEIIKRTVDGMMARGFGRIINITSSAVKSPVDGLGLSTGARSGLMSYCKGVSREVASSNVTINNLLPERIDTDRQRFMAELGAAMKGQTIEEAYDDIRSTIAARRLGTPSEFADACAFLCSAHAGYITGQSLLIDGGTFPGVL